MDKQIRTPRPKGLTEIGHTYNNTKTEEDLRQLQKHVIESYINTGFKYCNQPMNLEQFARYTNIPISLIMEQINHKGKDTFIQADPEEQGDLLRALLGITLGASLSDRIAAQQQLSILTNAQGNTYKPFISSEVNKALKLNQEATQGILAIAKSLGGSQGLSVTVNNTFGDKIENQQNNYLTSEKALELISQQPTNKPLLENPEAKKALHAQYGLGAMPVVKANQQQGIDTSKEGLSFDKLAELSDDKVDHLDEGPKSHIDRRAQEENIDLNHDEI